MKTNYKSLSETSHVLSNFGENAVLANKFVGFFSPHILEMTAEKLDVSEGIHIVRKYRLFFV